ncbi:carbohydrate binding module family protein [Collimonas fungivorans]|uniref:Carbohydrate binding module family protein n=1 Tax=Collimonas fungivorans TaxID=158899 RepID=A0A127PCF5_9BURK|nr:carbohydrate-binding protein [Collimonas fungivorans]AMO95355.1 carbohydrate binding module family protein [Collimonas fungivorans]
MKTPAIRYLLRSATPVFIGMCILSSCSDGGSSDAISAGASAKLAASAGSPYGGKAWPLPGTIQAEDFDTGGQDVGYFNSANANQGGQYRKTEGIGIEATSDTGAGYDVGWTTAGEWLNYTVNVAAAGSYAAQIRVASQGQGGTFHFNVDGVSATPQLTIPNTQGWQNWQTVSTNITLSAGQHVIQLHLDSVVNGGLVGNFNWFSIGIATPVVDASTIDGRHMFGYQGWFACNGDGSPLSAAGNGWRHWAPSATPNPQNVSVDMWPDMRDVPAGERCNTAFVMPDGSPATLYSAWNRSTVNRHFEWMKAYGLDGVFLQEFVGELEPGSANRRFRDGVTANVRAGAEANGRVWAVMYDISGEKSENIIPRIKDHWAALAADGSLASSRYLHQGGRPVISIWGMGFTGHNATPAQANELIDWFTKNAPDNQRAFVIGGVPSRWRTMGDDSLQDPAWADVYRRFDVISPWTVGRYGDEAGAQAWRRDVIAPDLAEAKRVGRRYMPVMFPGGRNLPRKGGRFWWTQFYEFKSAGNNIFYTAMFDEVDEGTAMYKVAPNKSLIPTEPPASANRPPFITLDADGESLSSDFYLRLAREANRVLSGDRTLEPTRPISQ